MAPNDGMISKAKMAEILAEFGGADQLVVPLEAKTWTEDTFRLFVISGGAIRPQGCSVPNIRDMLNTQMSDVQVDSALACAAEWLASADALLIGSGAGMGVNSGLGTFRGSQAGVWPGLQDVDLAYEEICEARWFQEDPRLAWAFWGFCHRTYQQARPHVGYDLVREWAQATLLGGFCFTSNIDSHWYVSGWDQYRIVEVHGALRWLQCSGPCCSQLWEAPCDLRLIEENATHRVKGDLPLCPKCGVVARPAVQMFGVDTGFSKTRRRSQVARYDRWLNSLATESGSATKTVNIVCLELGCGLTVPTVRNELERVMRRFPAARLIRVNPEQAGMHQEFAGRGVSLPLPAGSALHALQERLARLAVHTRERATFVLWDKDGGGVEVVAPIDASVEQLLRVVRGSGDTEMETGESVSATIVHAVALQLQQDVAWCAPVPENMIVNVGEQRRATVLLLRGVRFPNGKCRCVEKRVNHALAMLDDTNRLFAAEDYRHKVCTQNSVKGVLEMARCVRERVLTLHGLSTSNTCIMQARIGLVYWGCEDVRHAVAQSMELSGVPKPPRLPLPTWQQCTSHFDKDAATSVGGSSLSALSRDSTPSSVPQPGPADEEEEEVEKGREEDEEKQEQEEKKEKEQEREHEQEQEQEQEQNQEQEQGQEQEHEHVQEDEEEDEEKQEQERAAESRKIDTSVQLGNEKPHGGNGDGIIEMWPESLKLPWQAPLLLPLVPSGLVATFALRRWEQ